MSGLPQTLHCCEVAFLILLRSGVFDEAQDVNVYKDSLYGELEK